MPLHQQMFSSVVPATPTIQRVHIYLQQNSYRTEKQSLPFTSIIPNSQDVYVEKKLPKRDKTPSLKKKHVSR